MRYFILSSQEGLEEYAHSALSLDDDGVLVPQSGLGENEHTVVDVDRLADEGGVIRKDNGHLIVALGGLIEQEVELVADLVLPTSEVDAVGGVDIVEDGAHAAEELSVMDLAGAVGAIEDDVRDEVGILVVGGLHAVECSFLGDELASGEDEPAEVSELRQQQGRGHRVVLSAEALPVGCLPRASHTIGAFVDVERVVVLDHVPAQGVVVVDGSGGEQATIDGSSTGLSRCPILHRSDGDLSACYGAHDPTC